MKNSHPTPQIRSVLKCLNKKIKQYFHIQKTNHVQRCILSGSSKSLWDAVRIAKDQNIPSLPVNMSINQAKINNCDLPNSPIENSLSTRWYQVTNQEHRIEKMRVPKIMQIFNISQKKLLNVSDPPEVMEGEPP